ncbi:MAG: DUF1295 domain-containing protein [Planctomycetes bacterium]|nr:DUF1295 domain-containing protein [Planctomycetota bacterium]
MIGLGRLMILFFSFLCYIITGLTIIYLVGFVGNLFPVGTVDNGIMISPENAIIIDISLLILFALQHSLMARKWFKDLAGLIVPKPLERSVYLFFACCVLGVMFWQWKPIPITVWDTTPHIPYSIFYILFYAGWIIVLLSTFMIDHFDFLGLRQAWLYLKAKSYAPPAFNPRGFYKCVRHPIYLGLLLSFWSVSVMTVGHLLFSAGMTVYIFIGMKFEERDLVKVYGSQYAEYRERTPAFISISRKVYRSQ